MSYFFFNPGQKKLRWLQLSSVAKIPLFSATQRYFHSNGLKEQPQKRTTTRLSVGSAWQLEKNKKKHPARALPASELKMARNDLIYLLLTK